MSLGKLKLKKKFNAEEGGFSGGFTDANTKKSSYFCPPSPTEYDLSATMVDPIFDYQVIIMAFLDLFICLLPLQVARTMYFWKRVFYLLGLLRRKTCMALSALGASRRFKPLSPSIINDFIQESECKKQSFFLVSHHPDWRLDRGKEFFTPKFHRWNICWGLWSYCRSRLFCQSPSCEWPNARQASTLGYCRTSELFRFYWI